MDIAKCIKDIDILYRGYCELVNNHRLPVYADHQSFHLLLFLQMLPFSSKMVAALQSLLTLYTLFSFLT